MPAYRPPWIGPGEWAARPMRGKRSEAPKPGQAGPRTSACRTGHSRRPTHGRADTDRHVPVHCGRDDPEAAHEAHRTGDRADGAGPAVEPGGPEGNRAVAGGDRLPLEAPQPRRGA